MPGPASMPAIRSAVDHQASPASPSSSATSRQARPHGGARRAPDAAPELRRSVPRCWRGDAHAAQENSDRENAALPRKLMPNASMFARVAWAMVSSGPAGWNIPRASPVRRTPSPTARHPRPRCRPHRRSAPSGAGRRSGPRSGPAPPRGSRRRADPGPAIGPPSAPENTAPSLSACSSEAAASRNTPRRQFPSVMTWGVSTTTTTLSPLTSVPSTSPSLTLNTSATRQRSCVAGKRERGRARTHHVARAALEVR